MAYYYRLPFLYIHVSTYGRYRWESNFLKGFPDMNLPTTPCIHLSSIPIHPSPSLCAKIFCLPPSSSRRPSFGLSDIAHSHSHSSINILPSRRARRQHDIVSETLICDYIQTLMSQYTRPDSILLYLTCLISSDRESLPERLVEDLKPKVCSLCKAGYHYLYTYGYLAPIDRLLLVCN